MEIQKYKCGGRALIKTRTYCNTIEHIEMLFNEALSDFPGLQKKDVNVMRYLGDSWKNMTGIEFDIPSGADSDDYKIREFEPAH